MVNNSVPGNNQYFIGLGRAMISLGPYSKIRYCPYNCAFCYVQSNNFNRYVQLNAADIVSYLKDQKNKGKIFDIIYISGDTDSFAPPRTQLGINLIMALEELNSDITFTTRTIFSENQLIQLGAIAKRQKNKKLLLIASISIPRLYSANHLESVNTPAPIERITTLKKLKEMGLLTVLAIRPFLPIISVLEYKQIIDLAKEYIDVVLGEDWYVDPSGIIERRVFLGPTPQNITFNSSKMDFDSSKKSWKLWKAKEYTRAINKYCKELNIPFYMRSKPAFDYLRKKYYPNK
jgi:DNA repair photolyase